MDKEQQNQIDCSILKLNTALLKAILIQLWHLGFNKTRRGQTWFSPKGTITKSSQHQITRLKSITNQCTSGDWNSYIINIFTRQEETIWTHHKTEWMHPCWQINNKFLSAQVHEKKRQSRTCMITANRIWRRFEEDWWWKGYEIEQPLKT